MRRLLLAVGLVLVGASEASAAYTYTRTITIDHTKCGGGSMQTEFPLWFTETNATYGIGGSGHVNNTVAAPRITGPADLAFYDSNGATLLKWEVTEYNSSTGLLRAWILTSCDVSTDKVIYLKYGDAAVTTFQGGAEGDVWNPSYVQGVWHFGTSAALDLNDATSHNRDLTTTGTPTATTGQVGGGAHLTPGGNFFSTGVSVAASLPWTVAAWVKPAGTSLARAVIGAAATDGGLMIYLRNATNQVSVGDYGRFDAITTAGTVSSGAWHYLVVTNNSGTGNLQVYIDTAAPETATGFTATDRTTRIGADMSGTDWDGDLDEIHWFSSARSANWVTATYNNQSSPSTFYTVSSESSGGGGGSGPVSGRSLLLIGVP